MIITRIVWMLEMLMKVNMRCNVALTFSNGLKCIKNDFWNPYCTSCICMQSITTCFLIFYFFFADYSLLIKEDQEVILEIWEQNNCSGSFCCSTFTVDFRTFTRSIAKFRIGVLLSRSGNEIMRWTYICIFRGSRPLWNPWGNT